MDWGTGLFRASIELFPCKAAAGISIYLIRGEEDNDGVMRRCSDRGFSPPAPPAFPPLKPQRCNCTKVIICADFHAESASARGVLVGLGQLFRQRKTFNRVQVVADSPSGGKLTRLS